MTRLYFPDISLAPMSSPPPASPRAPRGVHLPPERQSLASGAAIPWHRHGSGYVAIVLEGGYLEAGDSGRIRVQAGDAVVHLPFSAHADFVQPQRVELINLPLPLERALALRSGRLHRPDEVLAAARSDPDAAFALLASGTTPFAPEGDDVDLLARALEAENPLPLADWADCHGICERTVTRRFRAAFGIPPAHYRARQRALRAWRAVLETATPLADIAAAAGFADQAHMTRAIRALTGRAPGAWRKSCPRAANAA